MSWHKVSEPGALSEGRVTTVVAGRRSIALTHHDGRYGALDNHCPHQGGPLGEGSIEGGWLRCPWLADAMRRAEERGDLTFVGIRHEGAAAFAASAYGKLTGRLAACFAIAGPGSTNLLTGLYDAKVDRAPVLAISGQVPSKVMGRGAFQDLDLTAAFADVAVWSKVVHAGSDHAELMTLACKHARPAHRGRWSW